MLNQLRRHLQLSAKRAASFRSASLSPQLSCDKEYEGYAQDTFKWKRNFTVTYGLRYSIFGVPYEKNGRRSCRTTSLSQYFAERSGGQLAGIPSYALPDAHVTYALGGPVNNKPGYYPTDYNTSRRASPGLHPGIRQPCWRRSWAKAAYSASAAASSTITTAAPWRRVFASSGSPGLATTVAQPVNTNFTTGFRYTGSGLPTLPTVAGGAFPYTPPLIQGGFTTFSGVSSDLKAPY